MSPLLSPATGERLIPLKDINPTAITPLVTVTLIAINIFVFAFVQPHDGEEDLRFNYEFAAIPCEVSTGHPITPAEFTRGFCDDSRGGPIFPDKSIAASLLYSMFLHGGLLHLGFNMLSLWVFGNNVEEAFGAIGYVALYLVGGTVATFAHVLANQDSTIPLVGASGAIAAVMGAYMVLYPRHRVLTLLFIFLVPLPAAFFIGLWFWGQFQIDPSSNIAWEAHVGGFLFGLAAAALLRRRLLARVRGRHGGRAA
jgi:membrane associated rhomboid family serine protease